jgi:hypothetical protein
MRRRAYLSAPPPLLRVVGAKSQSANFREVAVATEAVLEAGRAVDAIKDQRLASIVPFLDQCIAHGQAVALDGGAAIGAHAHLREPRDVLRELIGFAAGAAAQKAPPAP